MAEQPEARQARTGEEHFKSRTTLFKTGRELLKKLGFPEDMHLSSWTYDPDQPGADSKGNEPGAIKLVFSARPHGYEHLKGFNSVCFTLDPQDGRLVGYGDSLAMYVVESWTAKLTKEEAKAVADPIAKEFGLTKPRPGSATPVPIKKSELVYVIPDDGSYGTTERARTLPYKCRLAWVIWYPSGDVVFVDAADGRILVGVGQKPNLRKPAPKEVETK